MPEVVALFGAHLQLRGHQPPAPSGGEALPDYGPDVAQDHDHCQARPQGGLRLQIMGCSLPIGQLVMLWRAIAANWSMDLLHDIMCGAVFP